MDTHSGKGPKLNDSLRREISFQIAFGATTKLIDEWLSEAGIKLSNAGLRKYWHSRKWVRLTREFKESLASRPEIQRKIEGLFQKWFLDLKEEFKKYAQEWLDELRQAKRQNPNNVAQFEIVGMRMVDSFNDAIDRAAKIVSKALRKSL